MRTIALLLTICCSVTWAEHQNKLFSGGKDVAIVSGVIRYYERIEGWGFLADNWENHDPIMLGPVIESGDFVQILGIRIEDFGLDPEEWTPSGVVVGPDDDLAREGITLGASVATDKMRIMGSFNAPANFLVSYDGEKWKTGGGGGRYAYDFEWREGGTDSAYLLVTRTAGARKFRPGTYMGTDLRVSPRLLSSDDSAKPYIPMIATQQINEQGQTQWRIAFLNSWGRRLEKPNSHLRFFMEDYGAANTPLRWKDIEDRHGNIWIVGVFVRRE